MSEQKKESKKKIGRPSTEMMDYGKDIIRDANMRRRNEEGQAFMSRLADLFWDKVKKYPGTMFWIPTQTDSYTTVLTFLPEEKYSRVSLPCNVYRLIDAKAHHGSTNKLNKDLIFDRVVFPDSCSYPPRVSFPMVDILRRMFMPVHDQQIYFMDPKAHTEFLTDAYKLSKQFSNSCEPKRLVDSSIKWLKKNVKENPERYTYNKENSAFLRYRKMFLESFMRKLDNDISVLNNNIKHTTDPGTLGYKDRDEAEQKISERINKINSMVMDRAIDRYIAEHSEGFANKKQLKKEGFPLTAKDYEFLPAPVIAELKWLHQKYKQLHNYNGILQKIETYKEKIKKGKRSLIAVNQRMEEVLDDPDGLGEASKYWIKYKESLENQRKAGAMFPESLEDPMVLKNAALLFAGEIRAHDDKEDAKPIMRVESGR